MVSNDDIDFNRIQRSPNNLITHTSPWIASYGTYDTVPANKIWVINHISIQRINIAKMEIKLYDPASNEIILRREESSVILFFEPSSPLILGEDWSIQCAFYTSGSSEYFYSDMLYTEQQIY